MVKTVCSNAGGMGSMPGQGTNILGVCVCVCVCQGKNTGVGSHSLLQGIFSTLGSNLYLPHQADSLPSELPGKSTCHIAGPKIKNKKKKKSNKRIF